MAIREPHVSIGHRHQPLKSSQLPIPLRHVAIRWRHQPINCPHRTIRFRHLSREWLHSGLKISTVTAGDSRPRFCLSTAPAAHVPGQPHISLRSFRLDAANRTLHKADEDTDLLQPSKRRRASLHRRRKRSSVIIFRLADERVDSVHRGLAVVLRERHVDLEPGALILVEDTRYRVRKLPILGATAHLP